jgi:type IVB pilus formation R64 PilN family outer membrane protein
MKKKILFLAASALTLTACDRNMPDTQDHLNKDSNRADKLFEQTHKVIEQQSVVSHSRDFYVASKSFQIEEGVVLPPVFDQKIIYSTTSREPLTSILVDMYSETGINFKFTPDAIAYMTGTSAKATAAPSSANTPQKSAPSGAAGAGSSPFAATDNLAIGSSAVTANVSLLGNIQLNMQYTGTFFEFVERIGTQFDLYWEYIPKTKTVTFYRTKSKTLALDVLPGVTTFDNNMTSSSNLAGGGGGGGGGSSSSSGGSSGSAGASTGGTNTGAVMTVDYKNDEGNAWKDTVATIQAMLSPEGAVTPNIRSGLISVTDIPERLARVEGYINKINDKARKKIAVKVDVFDVQLTASTDYQIDWNAIFHELGGNFQFISPQAGSPIGSGVIQDTIQYTYAGGGFLKSLDAIFKALSTIGDTTKVTGTTVYTVNGEPAPVQVVTSQDYIQSISFTAVSQNSSTTEVSVNPATVITGFFMVITPTLLSDNQILLNLAFSLSTADLTKTSTVCSTGQSPPDCPLITLPVVKSKNFMESVTLNPGQSVIFSGFQEVDNEIGIASTFSPDWWALGGSKGAKATKTTTVTIVTPYIIGR